MPTQRQLHLFAFMRPVSIHAGAWRYPGAYTDANFNFAHLKRFAQRLEAAKFDAFFMADHLAAILPGSLGRRANDNNDKAVCTLFTYQMRARPCRGGSTVLYHHVEEAGGDLRDGDATEDRLWRPAAQGGRGRALVRRGQRSHERADDD